MRALFCTLIMLFVTPFLPAAEVEALIRQARAALKKGDTTAAMEAARKAVEADPKSPDAVFIRGEAYAAVRKHAEAIKDYEAALALDKTYLLAVDRRGGERFKLGMIQESIDDFNTYLKAFPKDEPAHWRRGISFYYAGKYAEGAKQFYDGRVEFGADVENVFWHFLCNARKDGVEKAKKSLMALTGEDSRVPFMRIDALLREKAEPKDVLEAAEKAKLDGAQKAEAMFYSHLYLALYYEALGDAKKCQELLVPAVEKYQIGHYMWDVANVHLARMKKK